ncbi:S8 family peptidase [Haloarcula argentinensis]|uniref:S8 family serine peptidase n=1 Tax=Haloarcula argentinensis TaxID=43776 RepID=A0A847UQ74_HALAR|nr:S8 family serine peptidase [Haloarcula argentinensis]NLV14371.1 S8 family serine peptidase [Haloarcula argentinensis]
MTRTKLTLGVASLLVVSALFSGVGAGQLFGDNDTQLTQASGGADGLPEWHVTVANGEVSALQSWANESDQRSVVRADNASNTAVIRADRLDVGYDVSSFRSLFGMDLSDRAYVTDIQPVWIHSKAEPVTLTNESDVPTPELSTYRSLTNRGAEYAPDGVAFAEDANEARLDEVRTVTGQDQVTATGQGQTIAVIDSGVNTANGRVFGNGSTASTPRILDASKDFVDNETVNASGFDAVEDPNGHGTHVASTAAANPTGTENDGMAPQADILALRALNEDGEGSTSDIADSVRYAADHDSDVIVMSLGSPISDGAINDAIDYAVEEQNVSAVVVAAGNDRQGTRWVASPASNPNDNTIAVAASNTTDNANASVGYFSNLGYHPGTTDNSGLRTQGQEVDVAAPGMKIVAQTPTTSGTVTNTTLTGTSMAAPVVAGGTTAVLEDRPDLKGNHTAVREELRDSARPMKHAAVAETGQGMFAGDNLNESVDPFSQQSKMTDEAAARDQFWQGLSDSSGGWLARLGVGA